MEMLSECEDEETKFTDSLNGEGMMKKREQNESVKETEKKDTHHLHYFHLGIDTQVVQECS